MSITNAQKLKCNSVRSQKILQKWGDLDLDDKYDSNWFEEYNNILDETLSLHQLECVVRDNKHGILSFPTLTPKTIKKDLHGLHYYVLICVIMYYFYQLYIQ